MLDTIEWQRTLADGETMEPITDEALIEKLNEQLAEYVDKYVFYCDLCGNASWVSGNCNHAYCAESTFNDNDTINWDFGYLVKLYDDSESA
ncbi:MAG: hypothetical protein FWG25_11015 [Promicromonosporaceae bacterium]|nr:hypothetical protein [Promicromonosporaceae bacterium]